MKRPVQTRAERGFALVPALFLLVVLGALVLVGMRVGTGQQHAVTMGLMQARALSAARAGVEFASYLALNGNCSAANTTLNLSEASLNGFAVTVTCNWATFTNGTGTNTAYVIQATAISGLYGQPSYVRRVVSATLTDATS